MTGLSILVWGTKKCSKQGGHITWWLLGGVSLNIHVPTPSSTETLVVMSKNRFGLYLKLVEKVEHDVLANASQPTRVQ